MHYKYRWLYALLITLTLMTGAFFYDIAPALNTQAVLRDEEARLAKKLHFLRRDANLVSQHSLAEYETLTPSERDPALLSALLAAVQSSGLHLQAVNNVPLQSEEESVFRLAAKGNFPQLTTFIFNLEAAAYPMLVMDFTCQSTGRDTFLFAADILLLKSKTKPAENKRVLYGENPFCNANASLSFQDEAQVLRSVPLSRMKMIGYSQQGGRHQALLLLTENAVAAVQVGSLLGEEGGVVTEIQREGVRIMLPDKSERVIGQ